MEAKSSNLKAQLGVSHMSLNYKAEFDRNVRLSFSSLR